MNIDFFKVVVTVTIKLSVLHNTDIQCLYLSFRFRESFHALTFKGFSPSRGGGGVEKFPVRGSSVVVFKLVFINSNINRNGITDAPTQSEFENNTEWAFQAPDGFWYGPGAHYGQDFYYIRKYTKEDAADVHDKDVKITHSWSEDKSEVFTVRQLEQQVTWIDESIAKQTAQKEELKVKIAEAEKVLAG